MNANCWLHIQGVFPCAHNETLTVALYVRWVTFVQQKCGKRETNEK